MKSNIMNLITSATFAVAVALFVNSTALAQPSSDIGIATGTTVVTTTPATGTPSTTSTTTYVNGPSAIAAQAAADKAKADLQTSLAQARSAQIAAANSLLPTSTTSGAVTLQPTAGVEEANVLAAVAINGAARRIIKKINGSKFLIVTGTSLPDFSGWLSFDAKLEFLKNQFAKAESDYAAAESLPPVANRPEDITGIGEVVSSLVKLAQLAATDWAAGGLALQSDDYMLAIAVSARAPEATIYNQSTSIEAYLAMKARLDEVDVARQLAARNVTAAAEESTSLKVQAKKDKDAAADDDTKKANALDAVVTQLNAAIASYDSYLSQLSGTSVASTPASSAAPANSVTFAAILQQKAGFDASQTGGVLLLRVHSASGGFYTKKNLWSSFGAMPFYASGGAVVSFSFTKDGTHSAGLLEVVVPYNKVADVKTIADMDDNGECNTKPDKSDSAAAAFEQYCP